MCYLNSEYVFYIKNTLWNSTYDFGIPVTTFRTTLQILNLEVFIPLRHICLNEIIYSS